MAYLGGRLRGVQNSLVSYLSPNLEKSCLQLTVGNFDRFLAKRKAQ